MNTTPAQTHTRNPRFIVLSWALVALWACLIFFMSSNTSTGLSEDLGFFSGIYQNLKAIQTSVLGPDIDVLSSCAHFCEYAVFGILWVNALRCHMSLKRACIVAVACASLYGITDEFHQYFVPDRMSDPLDWLVDTTGATLGASLTYLKLRTKSSTS